MNLVYQLSDITLTTRKKGIFIGTEKAYTPHSSRLSGWRKVGEITVDGDHIATGEKWDEWLDELEREMKFFRIKGSRRQDRCNAHLWRS